MQDNSKQKFLKGSIKFNKNLSKLNIFDNWINTNRTLNDFYNHPEIELKNDKFGLGIKNSMRHTVGSAKYQQDYGFWAKPFGGVKEVWDIITEPFIYMAQNKSLNYPKYLGKTIKDTSIDLENNRIGREYIKQNPKATYEEIMEYAYKQAQQNYNRQYNPAKSNFQQQLMKKERRINDK